MISNLICARTATTTTTTTFGWPTCKLYRVVVWKYGEWANWWRRRRIAKWKNWPALVQRLQFAMVPMAHKARNRPHFDIFQCKIQNLNNEREQHIDDDDDDEVDADVCANERNDFARRHGNCLSISGSLCSSCFSVDKIAQLAQTSFPSLMNSARSSYVRRLNEYINIYKIQLIVYSCTLWRCLSVVVVHGGGR